MPNNSNTLFDLSRFSTITVSGPRASEFLQGQLTCDVNQVTAHQIQAGALCNLKGRILAMMEVVDWQGLKLVLPADLAADTLSSLSKAASLSKVELSLSTEVCLFGFYYAQLNDPRPFDWALPTERFALVANEQACCYHLGDSLYVVMVQQEHAAALREPFEKTQQWQDGEAWHALKLQNKQLELRQDSRGLFLPHRLGLQHSGHISFTKGCYRGQEIIARTQYRATIKHEMHYFTVDRQTSLKPGQRLLNPKDGSEIAEVVDGCSLKGQQQLLAISALFEHPNEVLIEGEDTPTVLKLDDRS